MQAQPAPWEKPVSRQRDLLSAIATTSFPGIGNAVCMQRDLLSAGGENLTPLPLSAGGEGRIREYDGYLTGGVRFSDGELQPSAAIKNT